MVIILTNFSEGDFHSAEQEVRSGIYFSVSTRFR